MCASNLESSAFDVAQRHCLCTAFTLPLRQFFSHKTRFKFGPLDALETFEILSLSQFIASPSFELEIAKLRLFREFCFKQLNALEVLD